jgi:hypothetical protein
MTTFAGVVECCGSTIGLIIGLRTIVKQKLDDVSVSYKRTKIISELAERSDDEPL